MSNTYIASAKPLSRFIGRCDPCDRPVSVTTDLFTGDHYPVPCPDCGKFTDSQRLYGTIAKMVCDGSCMSAHGPICSCACGGVNHGDIWSRPGEMLADALAVYRHLRDEQVKRAVKAAETRARNKAARLHEEFVAWSADHADLVRELRTRHYWASHQFANFFLADMAGLIEDEKPLTEPQLLRTREILAKRREVAERIAREQAEREALAATATEVPTGRQFIEGPIIAAWTFDGEWGMVWKIKVDCGSYQVRGTLPQNLKTEALPQPHNGDDWRNLGETLKGRHVKLKATLSPDGRETGQGYFKRPSNAEFVKLQTNI